MRRTNQTRETKERRGQKKSNDLLKKIIMRRKEEGPRCLLQVAPFPAAQ